MKTIVLTVLLLPITLINYAQWNAKFLPANFNAQCLEVVNEDTAFVAGSYYGQIYRTFDGGDTWTSYQTPFNFSWFFDMDMVDKQIGYASGGTYFGTHFEILSKTIDGGVTWDSITANSGTFGHVIEHIDFVNADTGFLAGQTGLHITQDGGQSFTQIPENFQAITEVYFKDENLGFVATRENNGGVQEYHLYRTDDLGSSWTIVHTISGTGITKVQMLDAINGYAIGGNSTILKTTDGGLTWTSSSIAPHTTSLTAMSFTDVNTGYINNVGGIFKTVDGGQTWEVQSISPLSIIHLIEFANDSVGFAAGQSGIYKTENGGTPVGIHDIETKSFILYPNPANDRVFLDIDLNEVDRVEVYDMHGRMLLNKQNHLNQGIDVSSLTEGNYVVKVYRNGEARMSQLMILH